MKKILEERLQKDIILFFKINGNRIGRYKLIKFIINDMNNSIIRITSNREKTSRKEEFIDNDGDVIQITSELYHIYKKYDSINNKKLLVSQLYKYRNGNENLHEYKYDENGNDSEEYINNRLVTKYKFEGDKIKKIIKPFLKNKIKYEYDYKDGFTIVKKNGNLSCKFNKTTKIHYNDNNEIELEVIQEFDEKDRLIKYSSSKNLTMSFEYKDNKMIKATIYDVEYIIEYTDNEVIIKNI